MARKCLFVEGVAIRKKPVDGINASMSVVTRSSTSAILSAEKNSLAVSIHVLLFVTKEYVVNANTSVSIIYILRILLLSDYLSMTPIWIY